MTKFTGPLTVGALDQVTDHATIEASGTASFSGGLSTLKVVDAVTTAAVTADNTGAQPVPASAATFMEVDVNGTTYMLALFTKAT